MYNYTHIYMIIYTIICIYDYIYIYMYIHWIHHRMLCSFWNMEVFKAIEADHFILTLLHLNTHHTSVCTHMCIYTYANAPRPHTHTQTHTLSLSTISVRSITLHALHCTIPLSLPSYSARGGTIGPATGIVDKAILRALGWWFCGGKKSQ